MENKKVALLTFDEYYKIINPQNKFHDGDSTYEIDLKTLRKFNKLSNRFDNKVSQFSLHGIDFEIKESITDRVKDKYVKSKKDNKVTYYSEEELLKRFKGDDRYDRQHSILNVETQEIVAETSNEYGAILIQTAKEYQNLGLGQKLLNHHRDIYPFGDSGGHTESGYKAVKNYYAYKVLQAIENGDYDNAIKNGDITSKQKKIIVNSDHIKEFKKKQKKLPEYKLNMDNSDDHLFLIESNSIYIYDKKILEMNNDKHDYFKEQGLIGYAYIGGNTGDDPEKIFRLYGKDKKIEMLMMELAFNINIGKELKVYKEEDFLISESLKSHLVNGDEDVHKEYNLYTLNESTIPNLELLSTMEKLQRNKLDKYGEKKDIIQENFYGISEEVEEKRLVVKELLSQNNLDRYINKRDKINGIRKIDNQDLDDLIHQVKEMNFNVEKNYAIKKEHLNDDIANQLGKLLKIENINNIQKIKPNKKTKLKF